jgi:structural maintenance of chromosome 2
VRTALSLVGYEDEVQKAITYIFTDTLICDDAETAKKVTFARDVGVRSVTLDGDVYDPSGTLSGGAAPSSTKVLIQVQELLEVESRLREAQNRLQGLGQAEEKARGARERWRGLVRDLEIKQHELKLLQEQVEGSNASLVSICSIEPLSIIACNMSLLSMSFVECERRREGQIHD